MPGALSQFTAVDVVETAGGHPAPAPEASLKALHHECLVLWRSTAPVLPPLGNRVSRYRRWRNSRAAAAVVDLVAGRLSDYPAGGRERQEWRDDIRQRLLAFGEAHLGWPAAYGEVVFDDCFYDAAAAFATRAHQFDPSLSLADLGQALRNVWVGNSLQILDAGAARLTPALFAYSMLYPATDNILDAPDLPRPAKRTFNERLGRRLAGEPVAAGRAGESHVWALLDTIENDYPRHRFPGVWRSLLDIHRAQHASLRQQESRLSYDELLDLTIAKGGASVRADMYIVAGTPRPDMERIAFLYGVFLQMLDDLQDIEPDLAANHETLFTSAARSGSLDALTRRLARFIDRVLALYSAPSPAAVSCTDLIRRNCLMLLVGVVARHPQLFGRSLRRDIERQWPMTLNATRRLLRRAQHQLTLARTRVQQRHGTDSVLELLLHS